MRCPFCEGDGVIDEKGYDGRRIAVEAVMFCIESGQHRAGENGICPTCSQRVGRDS